MIDTPLMEPQEHLTQLLNNLEKELETPVSEVRNPV